MSSTNFQKSAGNGIYVVLGSLIVAVLVAGFLMFSAPRGESGRAVTESARQPVESGLNKRACKLASTTVTALIAEYGPRILILTDAKALESAGCKTEDALVLHQSK